MADPPVKDQPSNVPTNVPPAVPPPPCTISGFPLIHKVEADSSGKDKFARQTCIMSPVATMFIPTGVQPDKNNIHVCFTANDVQGDFLNAVPCHALRFAVAATDWILIAVKGEDATLPVVSAKQIHDFLAAKGRPRRIDRMRISCHSRGLFSLRKALQAGNLVSASPTPPVVDGAIVERVITFDEADILADLNGNCKKAGIDSSKIFGFRVNGGKSPPPPPPAKPKPPNWTLTATQTIDLTATRSLSAGLRAIEYGRLIDDAKTLRPTLTIPPKIDKLVTDLGLPPLGSFTSRKSPPAPLVNFQDFCVTKKTAIDAATGDEIRKFIASDLYKFVDRHDLVRIRQSAFPAIYAHHLLVSEFVHEVTDVPAPQP